MFDTCKVSIHAPGWARPRRSCSIIILTQLFQFTRPGGRDAQFADDSENHFKFQFTRPGGRDPNIAYITIPNVSCNSRARGGATALALFIGLLVLVFQFTRPGGRDTAHASRTSSNSTVSIHAPGWARHLS